VVTVRGVAVTLPLGAKHVRVHTDPDDTVRIFAGMVFDDPAAVEVAAISPEEGAGA
jgi:hypothetical protein